jgi:hypothetical protein
MLTLQGLTTIVRDKKAFRSDNKSASTLPIALRKANTMLAHDAEDRNALPFFSLLHDMLTFVRQALHEGLPAHQVEEHLWSKLLALGHDLFGLFLRGSGSGDLGPTLTLPDGSSAERLRQTHDRPYRSVFGDFTVTRTVYGTREGRKITFVPLDNRLQLPASDYSYLLQKWDQTLGCEAAFARVRATVHDILGVEQPVDSLEQMSRHMAEAVAPFRESRPLPEPKEEGELFVVSADGKGIVMRRGPDDPTPKAHRGKGDKANKKRMAIVGAVYSVDRNVRTAEEVVAALFRDPRAPESTPAKRPEPVGKHVWASLSQTADRSLDAPLEAVFGWLKAELGDRNAGGVKEVVSVMDGQERLWQELRREPALTNLVEVLDLLHAIPRLWQAAHLFHKEGSVEAREFVRGRLLRVLRGEVKGVVMGLRRLGTLSGLAGAKQQRLQGICRYLKANAARMRYDEYLSKGYPIASGVIEGACRHYVKDRLERSGMRWSQAGAQAMLDVRSEYLNGDWEGFYKFRIERETARLYPHREFLEEVPWALGV